ncbi:unnamed protein product [Allacma fusca]|uniref:Neuroguidin n=1 Tax=Allacma fusca TaxID=39272 RepID=A0A8J2KVV9_9HEXA|nr:unnamed protein product [Allacma fusca]
MDLEDTGEGLDQESVLNDPEGNLDAERGEVESKLKSITEQVNRCIESVKSLKSELDTDSLSTRDGMSFLDVKNHLLIQYLINLTGIVKLKTAGRSIQESVFLKKLVELRVYLEKIKPIETKLRYQIDKLVNSSVNGAAGADPLKFRANLEDLQNDDDESVEDSEEEDEDTDKRSKTGIYRPPKVAPQSFEDEDEVAPAKKAEKNRKKSINQSLIRELQEEFLDTPVEIHNMGDAYAKQLSREVRDKQQYEENFMTRLPVTKQDKHRSKAMSTIGVLGDEITSFKRTNAGPSKGKKRKFSGKKKGKGKKFKKS